MRRAGVRTLFDFCACVLGGCDRLPVWPSERAGRLAVCAHLRDQDDLHLGSVAHPGGVVWSAVAACETERDVTFAQAIGAAAFGYELTVRLAEAAGADHRARWHVTTTAGMVGAAGAAAQLLAPSRDVVVDAVAHAVSVAGGSAHAMVERSGTRFLHRAHAASSGVACARAARAGVRASRLGLGSPRGAFAAGSPAELAGAMLAGRDATCIEETGFRLHAANGFAHAAIDAALTLGPVAPAEIARVKAVVSPAAAVALASNPAPTDTEEAWWSVEHAVAVCLATGDASSLVAGLSARHDVLALCRRVELAAGAAGWGATIELTRSDGTLVGAAADEPRGHRRHPASDEELLSKWHRLTGGDGASVLARLHAADDDEPFESVLREALASSASVLLR